jgi:hypothetical protein
MAVPKIIWSLWLQGWDSASDLVRTCAASWSRLNPGWEVRHLTKTHVDQLFFNAASNTHLLERDIPPEALSDVVRLELLARYGGVWADATTYCLAPLDEWLGPAVASGFFAFDRLGPDRMLSTWFLAADIPSPVISRWRDLTKAYWAVRTERDAYFWAHYLFAKAYETDDEVRCIWDSTPKISADGPHSFVPYQETLFGPVTDRARSIVETAPFPMLKLTHNLRPIVRDYVALYQWLCDREHNLKVANESVESWVGILI